MTRIIVKDSVHHKNKHTVIDLKSSKPMLYIEVIAVGSENHTKQMHYMHRTLSFFNIKPGGI